MNQLHLRILYERVAPNASHRPACMPYHGRLPTIHVFVELAGEAPPIHMLARVCIYC